MLEKDVKKELNKYLKGLGSDCYWHMHVPVGYGRTTIDYLGCYRGQFFGIETKRKGEKATCRQYQIIKQIQDAGGVAWVEPNMDLEETKRRFTSMSRTTY